MEVLSLLVLSELGLMRTVDSKDTPTSPAVRKTSDLYTQAAWKKRLTDVSMLQSSHVVSPIATHKSVVAKRFVWGNNGFLQHKKQKWSI